MNFDDMTKEEYKMSLLLKSKNRMEIDEILGDMQNDTL